MRALVQRVSRAEVRAEGRVTGFIGPGLLVLAGFRRGEEEAALRWVAEKIRGLRVFPDAQGLLNRSVEEVGGELLVVSQFTLYGEVERGRRPSFVRAAAADEAQRLYDRFLDLCREGTVPVAAGEFGAHMEVELVNEGPVTLWIER